MGWAFCGIEPYYHRQIGYGISATCDKRGCDAVIDRGLGYLCGTMHHAPPDDEPGCGRYYCEEHLGGVGPRGGCPHRGRHAWGKTFCQLIGYDGRPIDIHRPEMEYAYFVCACGRWEYRGDTSGLSLEHWGDVPGYLAHLAQSRLVTDMQESGEAPLDA